MDVCDRGIAVAMSLGGRAGRIARSFPQAALSQPDGLFQLLTRIEQDLGSEYQDRVRAVQRDFSGYSRPRNMPASEYIVEFERRYCEARQHGLSMSVTMLSMKLLEQAGITSSQEEWIMQCTAGSYDEYDKIRRALRRLPALDSRHGHEASAWMAATTGVEQSPGWESQSESTTSSRRDGSARVFQDGGLNVPPAEHLPALSEETYLVGDDDSDSDDDYVSTCPSNEAADVQELLGSSFAVLRTRKFNSFKTAGKKPFRKGFKRTKSVWLADQARNDSGDSIPPGWDPKRWLARTKCPGCGSRWHRNCQGQGKTFAVFRRSNKGHGKGNRPSFKGAGKASFGIFLASAFSAAQSSLLPFSCMPCVSTDVCCNSALAPSSFNNAANSTVFNSLVLH